MPRKPRVEIAGFHHVLNRGVNRENIFLNDGDKDKFLSILNSARLKYDFTVHALCVMDNHYHLLLETHSDNLSLAVRQLNSQYAVYFNKNNNRVGPLWQGRFKSWYVFDERYLWALIRYIEYNPIQAHLVERVGEYPHVSTGLLANDPDSKLLAGSVLAGDAWVDLLKPDPGDARLLSAFTKTKFRLENGAFERKRTRSLREYFQDDNLLSRNAAIAQACRDGYGQGEVARHLGLSAVAISKVVACERAKVEQFERMKDKGLFWSYSDTITYDNGKEALLIETVLKYADIDEIKLLFCLFGKRRVKYVWDKYVRNDGRFKKLNYFLARVFFNIDAEAKDFAKVTSDRARKLRLLAG
jgi:REP element-mobilizing transposase RayT